MSHTRKIIIAVDDSDCSINAAKWACATLVRQGDEVHLVGCQNLISAGMGPAIPIATAGSVAALTATYQESLKQERERVESLLLTVKNDILKMPTLHLHSLPAAGGASGVGESIVSWAKHEHADLVVLGSRGMGAVKSTFMSIVGLGSVSEYCLHHLDIECAIAIVHGTDLHKQKEFRKIMVAVDDSEHAQHAQQWCIENILDASKDELHIVSVALPVPYVVRKLELLLFCMYLCFIWGYLFSLGSFLFWVSRRECRRQLLAQQFQVSLLATLKQSIEEHWNMLVRLFYTLCTLLFPLERYVFIQQNLICFSFPLFSIDCR